MTPGTIDYQMRLRRSLARAGRDVAEPEGRVAPPRQSGGVRAPSRRPGMWHPHATPADEGAPEMPPCR